MRTGFNGVGGGIDFCTGLEVFVFISYRLLNSESVWILGGGAGFDIDILSGDRDILEPIFGVLESSSLKSIRFPISDLKSGLSGAAGSLPALGGSAGRLRFSSNSRSLSDAAIAALRSGSSS